MSSYKKWTRKGTLQQVSTGGSKDNQDFLLYRLGAMQLRANKSTVTCYTKRNKTKRDGRWVPKNPMLAAGVRKRLPASNVIKKWDILY
jgi:hypothetical protein